MNRIPHSRPTLGDREAQAAADITASGRLADGRQCRAFEDELAAAVGRRHCVVVTNGHQAFELWLEGLGLTSGAKVRLPSYVCAALRHGIERRGLISCFEDVEEETLGLAPGEGLAVSANMFAIPSRGAHANSLEDCAMGFVPGCTGIRSAVSLMSFYVTKMLTTGQGGALLTDDEAQANEWRDLMTYDNRDSWRAATNRSLTDVQAAIGRVQLQRYPEFLERRRELLGRYREGLASHGMQLHRAVESAADDTLFRLPLQVTSGSTFRWVDELGKFGVEAKRPVWRPLHVDAGLSNNDFPVTTQAQDTIVSLPFYPSLTSNECDTVLAAVQQVADKLV